MGLSIIGTGSALPSYSLSNEELSRMVETSDEWISTRTGIRSRYICTTETAAELAVKAAGLALKNAGIAARELDYILCATVSGDTIFPSLACLVQKEIGASCPAFDISAACTGFLYALDIADGYFARKKCHHILVIGCEVMSRLVDWNDRSTCVLFGDGCGAAVLSEGDGLLSIQIGAEGTAEPLILAGAPGNCPLSKQKPQSSFVRMRGQDVFKFAVNAMCHDLADVISQAGLSQEEIDYVLPHQANSRILEAAKNRLFIPPDRYRTNIEHCGNTSAASIPLLLDELNRSGDLKRGMIIAMAAFGAGLTSGACVIRW